MGQRRRPNWDAVVPGLGVSAREYVKRHAREKADRALAKDLTRAGFPTTHQCIQQRRIALGLSKDTQGVVVRESSLPRYDSPPQIEGDSLVLGDVELPFHEHEFLNRAIGLARAWKIDHVVFAGDLLHHDKLSSFGPEWAPEVAGGMSDDLFEALSGIAARLGTKGDAVRDLLNERGRRADALGGISDEWARARPVLSAMRQVFEKATLIMGNHEGRLLRAMDSPLSPDDLGKLLAQGDWIRTAPYYYGLVVSGGVTWRISHPKNTSEIPALVAAKLADKFGQNVVQAHNHLWGVQQSKSGRYIGVEAGCCVDGRRLAYYAQRDTTRPAWQHGAAIIRDGFCTLLHPVWSDWRRLERQA